MPYQVLARKWRPQTFAEVVGQEHVARTLKNAILQNRIGHAYLFVGSRGIGKTTSARIFAKALNCLHNVDGEPCCQCENCREIAAGNSLDVIEIDGASHNKVEDIRDIRDNVQYTPTKSKYKIYIIDEVHMLTTSAWNALLKTLEEPPEHVKFIFATTEPHKVLPTIVSRCQRFDLRRIPVPLIVNRLRQIADGEHIYVDDAALAVIARAADGGMRDAQSILDQMIAFCGGLTEDDTITERDVVNVFGLASGTELREIAIALFANDLNRAFTVLKALADAGRDMEKMFGDLVEYLRNLMLASVCQDPGKFLEISSSELEDLVKLARSVDPLLLQRVLQSLVEQEWSLRSALNKLVYLEVILARAATNAHSVQLDDIATHLNVISGLLPAEQAKMPTAPVRPAFVPAPEMPAVAPVTAEPLADKAYVQKEESSKKKHEVKAAEPEVGPESVVVPEPMPVSVADAPVEETVEGPESELEIESETMVEIDQVSEPEESVDAAPELSLMAPPAQPTAAPKEVMEEAAEVIRESAPRRDFRRPTPEEMTACSDQPTVKKINEILGSKVIDARMHL